MIIETKFSVGDLIYYMEDNKVWCDTIGYITTHTNENGSSINYAVWRNANWNVYKEKDVFATKEDLLNSL